MGLQTWSRWTRKEQSLNDSSRCADAVDSWLWRQQGVARGPQSKVMVSPWGLLEPAWGRVFQGTKHWRYLLMSILKRGDSESSPSGRGGRDRLQGSFPSKLHASSGTGRRFATWDFVFVLCCTLTLKHNGVKTLFWKSRINKARRLQLIHSLQCDSQLAGIMAWTWENGAQLIKFGDTSTYALTPHIHGNKTHV